MVVGGTTTSYLRISPRLRVVRELIDGYLNVQNFGEVVKQLHILRGKMFHDQSSTIRERDMDTRIGHAEYSFRVLREYVDVTTTSTRRHWYSWVVLVWLRIRSRRAAIDLEPVDGRIRIATCFISLYGLPTGLGHD